MPLRQSSKKPAEVRESGQEFYHRALSAYFSAYRARTAMTQDQIAARFGISAASYRRLETNSDLNPAGVNFGVLLSIAEIERIRPSEVLRKLENLQDSRERAEDRSETDTSSSTSEYMDLLRDLEEGAKEHPSTSLIPNRVRWALKLGSYLVSLSEKTLLSLEIQILDQFLDSKPTHPIAEEARKRLRKIVTGRYAN